MSKFIVVTESFDWEPEIETKGPRTPDRRVCIRSALVTMFYESDVGVWLYYSANGPHDSTFDDRPEHPGVREEDESLLIRETFDQVRAMLEAN